MIRLSSLILLFSVCVGQASPIQILSLRVRQAGTAAPTYLVKQDFEGTGYDNSETWTEQSTPDEDYTTSPAPLLGSQSLFVSTDGVTEQRANSPSFSGVLEVWLYFMWVPSDLTASGNSSLVLFLGPGIGIDVNSSGVIRVGGSVNSSFTTDAVTEGGGPYHCLMHYIADQDGGAASAFCSFEFNTSATFSGSGNKYTAFTTGTETASVTGIRFTANAAQAHSMIIDKVRVDDVAIGNSPP